MKSRTPSIKWVWSAHLRHGETPVWAESSSRLAFVDGMRGLLLACDADGGHRQVHAVAPELGFAAPMIQSGMQGPTWLLGTGCRLSIWSATSAPVEWTRVPGDEARLRLNDSGCDQQGRLFTGTMCRSGRDPIGTLYRVDGAGVAEPFDDGYTIPNGFAFDAGRRRLYVADSPHRRIDFYTVDDDGRPGHRTPFVAWTDPALGYPDGMAVDADSSLWVACYEGARVQCFSVDGTLLRELHLTDPRVTACCFGGEGLRTLFITTGAGVPRRGWRRWWGRERGGSLWATDPGICGQPRAAVHSIKL